RTLVCVVGAAATTLLEEHRGLSRSGAGPRDRLRLNGTVAILDRLTLDIDGEPRHRAVERLGCEGEMQGRQLRSRREIHLTDAIGSLELRQAGAAANTRSALLPTPGVGGGIDERCHALL